MRFPIFRAASAVLAVATGIAVFGLPAGANAVVAAADPVTITVGAYPDAIAVDPGTHTAYVTNMGNGQAVNGNGTLSIVNGTDVQTIRLGGTPVGVAVNPTTHTAYVPVYNAQSKLVRVTPHGRTSVPLSNPQAVAVDASNGTVWVLEAPRILAQFVGNAETDYAIKGSFPEQLAVDPVTHIAYVLSTDGVLSEVTTTGLVLIKRLGRAAAALAIDSEHGLVYVAHSEYFGGGVSHPALLSVLSGLTVHVVDLGSGYAVGGLALDPSTGTAYVTEYTLVNQAVGRLAAVKGTRVKYTTVGGTPGAVSFDAADGAACVANRWSSTASIVQNGTAQDVPTGDFPIATATDDAEQLCYVANFRSNSVTEVPMP